MKNRFLGAALRPMRDYFELTVQEPLSTLAPVVRKRISFQQSKKVSRVDSRRLSSEVLAGNQQAERPRFVGAQLGVPAGLLNKISHVS